MDSPKADEATDSGPKDSNSNPDGEEEKEELFPGFRDADAFVKVSELKPRPQLSGGQRACACWLEADVTYVILSTVVEDVHRYLLMKDGICGLLGL